ncbi:hypothetical protein [Pseudomonas sp. PDM31]|jgi:hypothetical protein|uniref:hypothetical protein n=1 Tax=Pseudomonas sp. PDM31 TaxID=2854778 RepID=UPI001C45141D|nr:hypothetical protein [Pseudomonas sp. PDM31]MBV7478519.1 hypothetical protein [Pseudomonas sp. PDM31]
MTVSDFRMCHFFTDVLIARRKMDIAHNGGQVFWSELLVRMAAGSHEIEAV